MKFINRKFVWLILSLVVFSLQAKAQEKTFDESVLSEKGKQAYQTLLKIKLFAIGGIGYGGETSEGEKAFDTLLAEKEATSAYKSLVKAATLEGSFYGLFGLKMKDCDCYQDEFAGFKKNRLSNNKEKLSTQAGCSPMTAESAEYKEILLDLWISNGFNLLNGWKRAYVEQSRKLKEQKQINNGVKKNQ